MKMTPSQWCDEAAEALGGLMSPELFEIYMQWISQGICKLWRVTGNDYVTWLITRVEQYPNGLRELVLEVIAGKNARQIVKQLLERAKNLGIHTARFETHHSEKVAQKFIGGLGFKRRATTFEVVL